MSYVILDDQILVCYFGFSRPYRAIALQVKISFLLLRLEFLVHYDGFHSL